MDADISAHLIRLREAKDIFIAQLERFSHEERTASPDSGWNMLQVMEHVIISEKGTLEYMKQKTKAPFNEIPVAGEENSAKSDQLIAALKSDKKWKAPDVLPEPTSVQSFENMLVYWNRLRDDYDTFLNQLDREYYHREIFKHPFTGRLNLFQTMDFLINHIHHHLHQLNRNVEHQIDKPAKI